MTAIELFHVGILVDDLDAALARYSSVLHLTFEAPRRLDVVVEESGEARPRRVRVAYSIEGPPFLELIESQADGLWGHQHGEGLHHVGAWDGDLIRRWEELAGIGPAIDTRIYRDGVLAAVYLDRGALHGVRLELVVRPEVDPAGTPE